VDHSYTDAIHYRQASIIWQFSLSGASRLVRLRRFSVVDSPDSVAKLLMDQIWLGSRRMFPNPNPRFQHAPPHGTPNVAAVSRSFYEEPKNGRPWASNLPNSLNGHVLWYILVMLHQIAGQPPNSRGAKVLLQYSTALEKISPLIHREHWGCDDSLFWTIYYRLRAVPFNRKCETSCDYNFLVLLISLNDNQIIVLQNLRLKRRTVCLVPYS
jgi:hypothetical protein